MSEPELVLREDRGPIAILRLNRPQRRNALNRALVDRLSQALEQAAASPSVRALVLTGEGSAFCSGMDLTDAAGVSGTLQAESEAIRDLEGIAELITRLHRFPRLTVAALNGVAFGGGAGLALTCDLVVADPTAWIAFPEVRRGLVPSIVLHDVLRLVGERRARELLLIGRPINASTAERWGLISRVSSESDSLGDALELAHASLASGPRAIETTKRLFDDASLRPADLKGAAAISAAVRVSDEAAEGMAAFVQGRPPAWAPAEPDSESARRF